jgi:hypothetical protein
MTHGHLSCLSPEAPRPTLLSTSRGLKKQS